VPNLTLTNELQVALQGIVPAESVAAVDRIMNEAEPFEYSNEGQHLANAVVTRRNEFIAGRRCARAALSGLGETACALPANADGIPAWPKTTVGSISHTRGLCCAVAAPAAKLLCLGVDIEKTTRLSPRAMLRVVHPLEASFVGDDQVKGSLLFSAKEAFFKAQFPKWGAQPNFKDLALHIDTESEQLSVVEIAQSLPKSLCDAATRMQFRYRFFGDYVVTVCWLNRLHLLAQPRELL